MPAPGIAAEDLDELGLFEPMFTDEDMIYARIQGGMDLMDAIEEVIGERGDMNPWKAGKEYKQWLEETQPPGWNSARHLGAANELMRVGKEMSDERVKGMTFAMQGMRGLPDSLRHKIMIMAGDELDRDTLPREYQVAKKMANQRAAAAAEPAGAAGAAPGAAGALRGEGRLKKGAASKDQIIAELKRLEIKGYSGKNREALLGMLPEGNPLKSGMIMVEEEEPAAAPAPAPEPERRELALFAPAPEAVAAAREEEGRVAPAAAPAEEMAERAAEINMIRPPARKLKDLPENLESNIREMAVQMRAAEEEEFKSKPVTLASVFFPRDMNNVRRRAAYIVAILSQLSDEPDRITDFNATWNITQFHRPVMELQRIFSPPDGVTEKPDSYQLDRLVSLLKPSDGGSLRYEEGSRAGHPYDFILTKSKELLSEKTLASSINDLKRKASELLARVKAKATEFAKTLEQRDLIEKYKPMGAEGKVELGRKLGKLKAPLGDELATFKRVAEEYLHLPHEQQALNYAVDKLSRLLSGTNDSIEVVKVKGQFGDDVLAEMLTEEGRDAILVRVLVYLIAADATEVAEQMVEEADVTDVHNLRSYASVPRDEVSAIRYDEDETWDSVVKKAMDESGLARLLKPQVKLTEQGKLRLESFADQLREEWYEIAEEEYDNEEDEETKEDWISSRIDELQDDWEGDGSEYNEVKFQYNIVKRGAAGAGLTGGALNEDQMAEIIEDLFDVYEQVGDLVAVEARMDDILAERGEQAERGRVISRFQAEFQDRYPPPPPDAARGGSIYCGAKASVPRPHDRRGTAAECFKKGIGVGLAASSNVSDAKLQTLTIRQLGQLAKERGVPRYSLMRREQLIEAIRGRRQVRGGRIPAGVVSVLGATAAGVALLGAMLGAAQMQIGPSVSLATLGAASMGGILHVLQLALRSDALTAAQEAAVRDILRDAADGHVEIEIGTRQAQVADAMSNLDDQAASLSSGEYRRRTDELMRIYREVSAGRDARLPEWAVVDIAPAAAPAAPAAPAAARAPEHVAIEMPVVYENPLRRGQGIMRNRLMNRARALESAYEARKSYDGARLGAGQVFGRRVRVAPEPAPPRPARRGAVVEETLPLDEALRQIRARQATTTRESTGATEREMRMPTGILERKYGFFKPRKESVVSTGTLGTLETAIPTKEMIEMARQYQDAEEVQRQIDRWERIRQDGLRRRNADMVAEATAQIRKLKNWTNTADSAITESEGSVETLV